MSLTWCLLLVLITTGILASTPADSPTPIAATKITSLLMGVKLRRHDVLKGRNWIKALLLICSTASAFGLLLVFSIRVGFLF